MMKKSLFNKIVLGTVQFGLPYGVSNKRGKIPKKEAFEILEYAYKNRIVFIDTSYAYGDSEVVLGGYLKKSGAKFKIISKLPGNRDKKSVDIFHKSLNQLNTNKIYGYLIHDFDFYLENPQIWAELRKIKGQGKVRKIGFSLYYPGELVKLLKNKIEFDILQLPYSVFDQRFSGFFKELKNRNVEIHTRSVFLQGLVFEKVNTLPKRFLKIKHKLETLEKLAGDLAVPVSSLCLNFAVLNPFIDKVIIGVDNIANLKENLNNLKHKGKVKKIYNELLNLKEEDENIILPTNWKQGK